MEPNNGTPLSAPSLTSVMASQPTADAPFGDGVSPVAPAPVVDATQQQFAPAPAPVAPVPATAPVEDAVVAEFRQLGYDIPSGMDRKTFLDQIASQIDNANKITSEWEAQKSASNPDAGIVAPAPIPTPAAPALSDTAKALQSQGLLKQGAGGVWVANDPNLKHFADEANSVHQYRQQQAQQLVDSPDKYITPHVETAFQQFASPIQKELAELKATMAADRQQKEDTRVDNWVNQNESQLFVGGDRQQFTPYAKSYNEFAAVADSNAQFLGKTLTRSQRHDQTLKLLSVNGVVSQTQPVPQPAPQPQTFMQQAAAQPANGNWLSQHPAQQPNGSPQLGRTPSGPPRLDRIMALQQAGQLPLPQ